MAAHVEPFRGAPDKAAEESGREVTPEDLEREGDMILH
jgi:hypothetical protein